MSCKMLRAIVFCSAVMMIGAGCQGTSGSSSSSKTSSSGSGSGNASGSHSDVHLGGSLDATISGAESRKLKPDPTTQDGGAWFVNKAKTTSDTGHCVISFSAIGVNSGGEFNVSFTYMPEAVCPAAGAYKLDGSNGNFLGTVTDAKTMVTYTSTKGTLTLTSIGSQEIKGKVDADLTDLVHKGSIHLSGTFDAKPLQ